MFVPVVAGSDKTTVSVAMGHQEYHPVYISPSGLSNTACCGHSNSVLPLAFLPILKGASCLLSVDAFLVLASKWQQKQPEFQRFCHQLYH